MIETIVSSVASCAFADARTASALELICSTSCYLKKKLKNKNLCTNKIREKKKEKRERKEDE